MLKVGDKAIDFKLMDAFGKYHQLSTYFGKKIVLYFYPKDNTPGCSKQACTFKDNYDTFKEKGVVVIGVSKDSVESHKKFVLKYELPFILLSNEKRDVLDAYGVLKEKKLFGKPYLATLRTTFLINEDGIIEKVFDRVSPTKGANEILEQL